ncbi:MAG TPA: hypothetical protein VFT95_05025 [Micromonosporaceae bacterium]|nr:hypothetical protein [Micromonosporaceae bacterium]
MTDPLQETDHPVAYGLLALVGVGVVVGLILGLGALAGAKVVGVGGESAEGASGGEASMYLPKPEKTQPATGPEITLQPGQESSTNTAPSETETAKDKKPKKVISLSAAQTQVAPMEQIDLSGTYPGGEGAILQVQRFENGQWTDFPASPVSVSDQTFSTYVLTGIPGQQRFRMIDTGSGKTSNEVKVTVTG